MAALLVFLIPLLSGVKLARDSVKSNPSLIGYFPEQLAGYMRSSNRSGRIFNEYQLGGYLIHELSPKSQVYIDGRTEILYPIDHYRRLLRAKKSANFMSAEIEAFDIDYVILQNTFENAKLMAEVESMSLDFPDLRYSLYSRHDASFPVAGRLWGMPYCWQERMAEGLADERAAAVLLLPEWSPLHSLLHVAAAYGYSEDKEAFFRDQTDTEDWSDPAKRFVGYRALEHGHHELALRLFGTTAVKEPMDYLAGALASLRAGDPGRSEEILDQATKSDWRKIEFGYFVILSSLLQEIQAQQPLRLIELDYVEQLTAEVEQLGTVDFEGPVAVDTFCRKFD
jgi:hypothetical protein